MKRNQNSDRKLGRFVLIGLLVSALPSLAQKEPSRKGADKVHEMLRTDAGLLAIDTPEGFERVDKHGPALALFVPRQTASRKSGVVIYVSSIPIGPSQDSKDFKSAVQADIDGFKAEYKNGTVKEEEDLELSRVKRHAPRYIMMSGEKNNGFEQVVYIDATDRAITLVLSTRNQDDFARTLPVFHTFARSYGGLIVLGSKSK